MQATEGQSPIKTYTELDICGVATTNSTDLRKLRKDILSEGEHYFRAKFNQIRYTESGYNKILELLGARTEVGDQPIEVEVLYATPNRNLLICALPDGREIPVRVKGQAGFRPGLKIKVKKDIGTSAFMYLGGNPGASRMTTITTGYRQTGHRDYVPGDNYHILTK